MGRFECWFLGESLGAVEPGAVFVSRRDGGRGESDSFALAFQELAS
jgi:hypothetical protein